MYYVLRRLKKYTKKIPLYKYSVLHIMIRSVTICENKKGGDTVVVRPVHLSDCQGSDLSQLHNSVVVDSQRHTEPQFSVP